MRRLGLATCLLGLLCCGLLGCEGRIDTASFRFGALRDGAAVEGEVEVELGPGFNALEQGVSFLANGRLVDEDRVRPYRTRLDTRALPEGALTLEIVELAEADSPWQDTPPVASLGLIVDNLGPEITLAQPKGIPCVKPGDRLTISAQASDHVGVKNVDFRIAGESIAHFTSPPYEHTLLIEPAHLRPAGAASGLVITIGAENQRGLISNQTTELPRCAS